MKFVSLYFCCPFHPTSISLRCERLTYIVHYWPDLKGKSCYSLMDALLVGPQLKFKLVKAIFSFNYLFGRQESPAVAGERPPGFFLSGMNIWNGTIRCRFSRLTPPVTTLCGSHHSFLFLLRYLSTFPPPPSSLLLRANCLSICTASLLSVSEFNVSEPSSLT